MSPVLISRCRRWSLPTTTTFEIVCARACVGYFAAIVVLLYQPYSQPLQQQQTFIDELTPVLKCVKFDVAFMHRIVSYCIAIFCVISHRIVSFSLVPYRANTSSFIMLCRKCLSDICRLVSNLNVLKAFCNQGLSNIYCAALRGGYSGKLIART